ncbi:DUF4422 domain-containing protein [Ruminococcus sp. 5_1_39BFAA]|uniref:DUF4422 domain-containing protein n=1 Tax=Ruminococcus sp. 5_1_39BFAA TaxID=457412 RepID=UPI00356853EE
MEHYTVKVIIATHKRYQMPKDDMYLPLHVGAEGKTDVAGNDLDLGYLKDNTGDNISALNSSFCELTGLYWAWKNIDADYVGLVHYRRHFCIKKKGRNLFDSVLSYRELRPYLGKVKVFTPNKRNYYIETLYSHYAHTHYSNQLDETRKIIYEKYPDYIKSYDEVIQRTYGYMFNMMIMDRESLNEYCSWLFDILFELSKRIEIPELSAFQGRFYGRISEIIFNVWLDYQMKSGTLRKNQIKEIPCIHMEKINWGKKGIAFLNAKFLGKKYEGSF